MNKCKRKSKKRKSLNQLRRNLEFLLVKIDKVGKNHGVDITGVFKFVNNNYRDLSKNDYGMDLVRKVRFLRKSIERREYEKKHGLKVKKKKITRVVEISGNR